MRARRLAAAAALWLALVPLARASPYSAHVPPLYSPSLRTWWEGWEVRLVPYDEPEAWMGDEELEADAADVPSDVRELVRGAYAEAPGARVETRMRRSMGSRAEAKRARKSLSSPSSSRLPQGPFPAPPSSYSIVLGSEPRGELGWNITLVRRVEGVEGRDGVARSEIVESVDEQLGVRGRGGRKVTEDPDVLSPPAVYVSSSPLPRWRLAVVDDECEGMAADASSGLWFRCLSPPVPWPEDDGSSGGGPEGAAAALPLQVVGGHWFVHSLATDVSYLRWDGKGLPIRGRATALFSKDWGSAYPDFGARVFARSRASDGGGSTGEKSGASSISPPASTHPDAFRRLPPPAAAIPSSSVTVALSGGQLAAPFLPSGVSPDAWFLGVFTPARNWTFRPQTPSKVDVLRDACRGTFEINVTDVASGRWARLVADAPPSSFAPLAGPSLRGIVPATKTSTQHARVAVELYEPLDTLWPVMRRWKLLERHVVQNAQLEFWSQWTCGGMGERGRGDEGAEAGGGGRRERREEGERADFGGQAGGDGRAGGEARGRERGRAVAW